MEDFTITTKLTTKDYTKTIIIGLYKQPVYIISTLLGVYFLTTVVLDSFNIVDVYAEAPRFESIFATFFLLMPAFVILIAVRQFASNPVFRNEMKYTFSEDGINVEAPTCKSEFSWVHIIKRKEMGRFIILYHTKSTGNYIDKNKLTSAQLAFIKSKVVKK